MIKYNFLQSVNDVMKFCGSTKIKPLSKVCGLPLDNKYFDNVTLLSKAPSYVWYNNNDEIVAFVLNTECLTKSGIGIKVVGYQSICADIAFFGDMLPTIIKSINDLNKDNGYKYECIIINNDYKSFPECIEERLRSNGFIAVGNESNKQYVLKLPNP